MSEHAKKVALLAMPMGGGMLTGAAADGYHKARCDPASMKSTALCGSLIDTNCSAMWALALNEAHKGRPFSYFAMQHADVQPPRFWLDALIEELEAEDLDVLSVVVPIKDRHGLTSTALGSPDLDDCWRCFCRLTMREVHALPETFTSADCGHPDKPLLVNTGCFVCRFDLSWAKHVWFNGQTRVVFDEKEDRYVVEAEPEDWAFSRMCHRQGLRVGATRKISLSHRGPVDHTNDRVWGDYEFDREYLDAPAIKVPEPPCPGWKFPADVEGWLSETEGRALAELAKGKDVLEVGSYCGRSTVCMAQTARHVTAVDTFDGRGTPSPRDTLEEFRSSLRRHGVAGKVASYRETAEDFIDRAEELACRGEVADFDLAFIDGAHDYDSVRSDIEHARSLLRPGGLLAFHDYRRRPGDHDGGWDPGVTRAVNALLAEGGELLSLAGTVAVVRPPALNPKPKPAEPAALCESR